jgi:uncharacterized protein YajQ (UPF0234 family)
VSNSRTPSGKTASRKHWSPLGQARQLVNIKQGLGTGIAKQLAGFIRESNFKLTAQIQPQQVQLALA